MRRAKSDPGKYVRNYKKITSRKMTEEERDDDDMTIDVSNLSDSSSDDSGDDKKKKKRNLRISDLVRQRKLDDIDEEDAVRSDPKGILSDELYSQLNGLSEDTSAVLQVTKKVVKKKTLELTADEIRAAKKDHRATKRKLKSILERREKKGKRQEIYESLDRTRLTGLEQGLMISSSKRGHTMTKRERIKHYYALERAGITLSKEQREELYDVCEYTDETKLEGEEEDGVMMEEARLLVMNGIVPGVRKGNRKKRKATRKTDGKGEEVEGEKKWVGIWKVKGEGEDDDDGSDVRDMDGDVKTSSSAKRSSNSDSNSSGSGSDSDSDPSESISTSKPSTSTSTAIKPTPMTFTPLSTDATQSFASQIMLQMTALKQTTEQILPTLEAQDRFNAEVARAKEEARVKKVLEGKKLDYVPSTTSLVTPHVRNVTSNKGMITQHTPTIKRLPSIDDIRTNLPVVTMEQEIIESIKLNDVIILCGETGSGKSTQCPQFVYEAGFTREVFEGGVSTGGIGGGTPMLIGITQPRRVAAVSTAKRVSHEMGLSTGQGIPNNNLVSYQTRYESSGLGSNNRIKFMTDGILLSEIREDLLLRKYGVVILDEAHERNLNTDILLGLLSGCVKLRREGYEENKGGLQPLKLIIMSATLRVRDFTDNPRLFPSVTAANNNKVKSTLPVITVPGRNFPVSIHHVKETEMTDYLPEVIKKTCKIHRKLPPGAILVFVTGRDEIIKVCNRLNKVLGKKSEKCKVAVFDEVDDSGGAGGDGDGNERGGLRDMDDDENDAVAFQDDVDDEDYDSNSDEENEDESDDDTPLEDASSASKTNVLILPLYSMLSQDEQSKVFTPVPPNTRLIVIATNIAETSITIPNVTYVVDSGRQKVRNYDSTNGISSYTVNWISKASADQRAGRAGRTGPGHCYRLFSSSVYSRYLEKYALPEVLSRPLEDVVLSMKGIGIRNIANFPFPTPPDRLQIRSAVKLLSDLSCLKPYDDNESDSSVGEVYDGSITELGRAVAKIPLGVRYAKMLVTAAGASASSGEDMVDYCVMVVAGLSCDDPFIIERKGGDGDDEGDNDDDDDTKDMDEIDKANYKAQTLTTKDDKKTQWAHPNGDALSRLRAIGAYTHAGGGAGGQSEIAACKAFCESNGLNYAVMSRITQLRGQLTKVVDLKLKLKLNNNNIARSKSKIKQVSNLPPPTSNQELKISQILTSGYISNIARRCTSGESIGTDGVLRHDAYLSCNSSVTEPLFVDTKSTLFSRDYKKLPEYICYDSIIQKTRKGIDVLVMTNCVKVEGEWLGSLAVNSPLLTLGAPLENPIPEYDSVNDVIMCSVNTKFGSHNWEVPPLKLAMVTALSRLGSKETSGAMKDDNYRWFARFLLDGKIYTSLRTLTLNDSAAIITKRKPQPKISLLISTLASHNCDTKNKFEECARGNDKFLWDVVKLWAPKGTVERAGFKKVWGGFVKTVLGVKAKGKERG